MNTRKYAFAILPLFLVSMGCGAELNTPEDGIAGQTEQAQGTGNGAPSGPHEQLNIIGVSHDKTNEMTGNNGGRIFVPLWGNTKIMLTGGNTFQVLDANGTDGEAEFMLPWNVSATYAVYARALGTPGGGATMQTCATDPTTGEVLCNVTASGDPITVELKRSKGKSLFSDVSSELLQICGVVGTANYDCYDLFSTDLYGYFWDYDNKGLKVAQLRFYPL